MTCWISIDDCGVTHENGAFHYVPPTAAGGYGEFGFDVMGRGRGEGLSPKHLQEEHVLTLARGDAVFHHSWTIHGTAPNETEQKRRGWALHYADARSRWGDHHTVSRSGDGILDHADPRARELCAKRNEERQTTAHGVYLQHGGRNFNAGKLHGNRDHVLVCGRAHEGCI